MQLGNYQRKKIKLMEYFCPFSPTEKCVCDSSFAKDLYESVVAGLINENDLTAEEAGEEYLKSLISNPISPYEASRYTSSCVNINQAIIEVKKK